MPMWTGQPDSTRNEAECDPLASPPVAKEFILLQGSANPALAAAVARQLGVQPAACRVQRFPDGEVSVKLEQSVRGSVVFVIQPTAPPVDEHLMELLVFADACRRAAAAHLTAVVPYFGYARSDRRDCRREPITASLVASLLECAGFDHVITVDLHTTQVEGFFHVPVDSLTAVPLLCTALDPLSGRKEVVVVSPDAGRVKMATEYANRLDLPLVVLHKKRLSGESTQVTHVVGDVKDRICILVDDMIATGGTLLESLEALGHAGARPKPTVVATHGLFVAGALDRLRDAGVREILTTDSVARPADPSVRVVSLAPLLAAAIRHELAGRAGCH